MHVYGNINIYNLKQTIMEKRNFLWSVLAYVMAVTFCVGFIGCGGGDDPAPTPNPINPNNPDNPNVTASIKVNGALSTSLTFEGDFAGKSGIDYKQSVAISSTVQWTMSKDADWLNVSPSNGSGTLEMVIFPTSENFSSTDRTATITLSGSGVSATISITQKAGKPVCYVEPINIVALHNRLAWEYEATGTVNKFQYILLSANEFNRMTDNEMMTELRKQEELKVVDDYLSTIGSDHNGKALAENSTYYVVTIAYDNQDKVGELRKVKVDTPVFLNGDKDAWVSFENVGYYNNWKGFFFDTKKEGYCNTYHIVYGLYVKEVNSVVHAFEINYYLKNKKKHWLSDQWGWEIVTDYPNNHTFNYYSTSLPADLQQYASQIPWAFASAWGVFKDGTLSSDLLGFQVNLSNYNSAPKQNVNNKNDVMPNRTFRKSEITRITAK